MGANSFARRGYIRHKCVVHADVSRMNSLPKVLALSQYRVITVVQEPACWRRGGQLIFACLTQCLRQQAGSYNKSQAGRFGTMILFGVLGLGVLAFVIKSVVIAYLEQHK